MSNIEIKGIESGQVEARGFLLEEQGNWILYPEPALNSCCRNGDLQMGLALTGAVPKECKGKCIAVHGNFQGNALNVTTTSSLTFPFWVIPVLILFIFIWSKRKKITG